MSVGTEMTIVLFQHKSQYIQKNDVTEAGSDPNNCEGDRYVQMFCPSVVGLSSRRGKWSNPTPPSVAFRMYR